MIWVFYCFRDLLLRSLGLLLSAIKSSSKCPRSFIGSFCNHCCLHPGALGLLSVSVDLQCVPGLLMSSVGFLLSFLGLLLSTLDVSLTVLGLSAVTVIIPSVQ